MTRLGLSFNPDEGVEDYRLIYVNSSPTERELFLPWRCLRTLIAFMEGLESASDYVRPQMQRARANVDH